MYIVCIQTRLIAYIANAELTKDKSFQMAAIKENPSSSDVSEILNEIGNFTASQMSSGGLYAGEVEGVTDVLETLANISNTDVNITANQSKVKLNRLIYFMQLVNENVVSIR